jgi:hypothetical protein
MIAGVPTRKPPKAVGTYGVLGVIRRRGKRPGPHEGARDIEAIRSGEERRVGCFLRGPSDRYPQKLKFGSLVLGKGRATWTPFWSFKRAEVDIDLHMISVQSRLADKREGRNGWGGGTVEGIQLPRWMVVTCNSSSGPVDLEVPEEDEPLVKSFFMDTLRP